MGDLTIHNKPTIPTKISSVKEFEEKAKLQLTVMLRFLKAHPTFSLTLFYLFISSFGLVYLFLLSTSFNINILPHLEFTDFILAPIHYPISILFFIGISMLTWVCFKLDKSIKKVKKIVSFYDKINKPFYQLNPLVFYIAISLFGVYICVEFSAKTTHKDVIKLKNQSYNLALATPSDISGQQVEHIENIQIIADSVKYLWVFINDTQQIHAIPQKNIAGLIPIIKKEKTKVQDAAHVKQKEKVTN